MAYTVFLGNLPTWVTADDIKSWLGAESLVADSVKVIRNPETQESKGFAFIEAPNAEEMQSIIKRFDRAPLEDKLLRANPAQPPKGKGAPVTAGSRPAGAGFGQAPAGTAPAGAGQGAAGASSMAGANAAQNRARRDTRDNRRPAGGPPAATTGIPANRRPRENASPSAFAEELAKAL